jgi:hypothetical protein
VADANFTQGQEALDRAEFDTAKQMLSRAASAFDRLGGKDERTAQARQLAREAAIFADLSSRSLEEIIDDAARTEPADWPRRFEINYQGRAVIVETEVDGLPASDETPGAYRLAYRVFVGRGPRPARTGRYDLKNFKLLEGRPLAKGDPVFFGARLGAIEYANGEWQIRLVSDSGVFITHFKALQSANIGWSRELTSGAHVSDGPRLEPEEQRP